MCSVHQEFYCLILPMKRGQHLSSQQLGQSCSDLHRLLQTRNKSSVHQQVDSMSELWCVHSVVYHSETLTERARRASEHTNSTDEPQDSHGDWGRLTKPSLQDTLLCDTVMLKVNAFHKETIENILPRKSSKVITSAGGRHLRLDMALAWLLC